MVSYEFLQNITNPENTQVTLARTEQITSKQYNYCSLRRVLIVVKPGGNNTVNKKNKVHILAIESIYVLEITTN